MFETLTTFSMRLSYSFNINQNTSYNIVICIFMKLSSCAMNCHLFFLTIHKLNIFCSNHKIVDMDTTINDELLNDNYLGDILYSVILHRFMYMYNVCCIILSLYHKKTWLLHQIYRVLIKSVIILGFIHEDLSYSNVFGIYVVNELCMPSWLG